MGDIRWAQLREAGPASSQGDEDGVGTIPRADHLDESARESSVLYCAGWEAEVKMRKGRYAQNRSASGLDWAVRLVVRRSSAPGERWWWELAGLAGCGLVHPGDQPCFSV